MTFFSHKLNKSRSFSNTSRFLLSVSKSTTRLGYLVGLPTGLRLYATWTLYTDMEFLYLGWYYELCYLSANRVNCRFSSRTLLLGLVMLKGNFLLFIIWVLAGCLTTRHLRYTLYWCCRLCTFIRRVFEDRLSIVVLLPLLHLCLKTRTACFSLE